MSKFLNLIENYDPKNNDFVSNVHDLKSILKSHGVKFGVTGSGVFYIDDPENNKSIVIEIKSSAELNNSEVEEDGEALDVVDGMSSIDPKAAELKKKYIKTITPKFPKAVAALNTQMANISKM